MIFVLVFCYSSYSLPKYQSYVSASRSAPCADLRSRGGQRLLWGYRGRRRGAPGAPRPVPPGGAGGCTPSLHFGTFRRGRSMLRRGRRRGAPGAPRPGPPGGAGGCSRLWAPSSKCILFLSFLLQNIFASDMFFLVFIKIFFTQNTTVADPRWAYNFPVLNCPCNSFPYITWKMWPFQYYYILYLVVENFLYCELHAIENLSDRNIDSA